MATAAERMAGSFNLGALAKAEELKKRILFTLGALIVYRLGTYIPIPGVDHAAFSQYFQENLAGGVLGMFNMFAGGAAERMTIFALNIMPYISAAIIMQLMTAVSPTLEQWKKEGEQGRKKINQYTRYGTVILAAFQAMGIAYGLQGAAMGGQSVVISPGPFFVASTVITLTGGTVFLMWLGEQITARGVGNGISLIIFSGIVANLPIAIAQVFAQMREGTMAPAFVGFLFLMVVIVIAFVVFMERAQRRIIVQYPKRQQGNRMMGGEASHLPLKLNTAGVIPPIFASSLLLMPMTVASFGASAESGWMFELTSLIGRGQPLYLAIYASLIVFFAFFYTAIVFNPQDTAENLRKYGGFVPGIRPGKNTTDYLDYVLTRITVVGAGYLALVCLLPELMVTELQVPFYFGGTSLLIIVSVTMDTVGQIQSHLLAHQYEGLIRKSKLRGRRR